MTTIHPKNLNPNFEVAIVVSHFNEEVTEGLLKGALKTLQAKGFKETQLTTLWVPGAVEIPLAAQRLAQTQKFKAILALGAVIRGETSHYDYVCQQVSEGCQHVALTNNIPVLFGVLTTENEAQALARSRDNEQNKGAEAVQAMMEVLSVLAQLS